MRRFNILASQLAVTVTLLIVPYFFWVGQGFAQQLSNRSVALSTATPSATASHSFQLTLRSASAVGSIVFEYCGNSPLFDISCTAPAGLDVSAATLASQSGNVGFTIDHADSTASELVISRPAVIAAATPSSYVFSGVINPSGNNQTAYVRISTYASSDGSGSYIDNGAVAFTTENNFEVGAFVPPFLNLCVGVSVTADCSQATGDSIDLGVLSSQTTRSATSQMAASTNSSTGYAAFILGTTMTSGNNVINANSVPSFSQAGSAQFGFNLRANTSPAVGSDPSGAGTGAPSVGYNIGNLFTFNSGDQIASSSTSTDYNRLTSSYIVNVPASQPVGIYSTTLTYLVSAQF